MAEHYQHMEKFIVPVSAGSVAVAGATDAMRFPARLNS